MSGRVCTGGAVENKGDFNTEVSERTEKRTAPEQRSEIGDQTEARTSSNNGQAKACVTGVTF